VAHEVMLPGGEAYETVMTAFGRSIVNDEGHINRARLAAIVFNDPVKLQQLEAIVHPAVYHVIVQRLAATPAAVMVIEAIKLLESGAILGLCNQVWVVVAQPGVTLERLLTKRHMTEMDAQQRLANQMPESERLAHADVIIDNSGSEDDTYRQVVIAWQTVQNSLAERKGC
jgi:dephospho-CoA kinase